MQHCLFLLYLTLGNPISLYPCIADLSILRHNLHLIIMANTNRRIPNAAAEPTRQSRRAAGKNPTADSPVLRFGWYDRGEPKDLPDSSAGTSRGTKVKCCVNRKSPPELLGADPVIQATLDSEEVAALLPRIVPADGQEATADTPANHKEATAQLPHIVPKPPQIG